MSIPGPDRRKFPPRILRFGIPSIDVLLGLAEGEHFGMGFGLEKATAEDASSWLASTSVAIVGPPGMGKSVLALHLSSHYAADSAFHYNQRSKTPRILYVSTDLSYEKASRSWARFDLGNPEERKRPYSATHEMYQAHVKLVCYEPFGDEDPTLVSGPKIDGFAIKNVASFISTYEGNALEHPTVGFVDLSSNTAGDDWGYLTRLVASLPEPAHFPDAPTNVQPWPHLMVIDAIEGLEMQVGERDSYGQLRTRRSRIAQLLRASARKCHLVFMVEQRDAVDNLPEEFVSDFVLRLRTAENAGYSRWSIEVTKARGQRQVRGEHDIVIRDGRGTSTGNQVNPDDRPIPHRAAMARINESTGVDVGQKLLGVRLRPEDVLQRSPHLRTTQPSRTAEKTQGSEAVECAFDHSPFCQAYVHVFPSLHQLARREQELRREQPEDRWTEEDFVEPDYATRQKPNTPVAFGLGYLDEMIGASPSNTECNQTSRGRDSYGFPNGQMIAVIGNNGTFKERLATRFLLEGYRKGGGVILLTHRDLTAGQLLRKMAVQDEGGLGGRPELSRSVVCRRLELSHVSSANFLHIIRSLVCEVRIKATLQHEKIVKELRESGRHSRELHRALQAPLDEVRMVIDDWSILMATHPNLRDDPLLLPTLNRFLTKAGVSTLLVAGRQGTFNSIASDPSEVDLLRIADFQMYTWHVPFFGERKVAIAVVPQRGTQSAALVRELTAEAVDEDLRVFVDPHFDLYRDIEDGDPKPIPLQVSLYQESEESLVLAYQAEIEQLLSTQFSPVKEDGKVCRWMRDGEYANLRDAVAFNRGTNQPYTSLFQVDEFWFPGPTPALFDLSEYLSGEKVTVGGNCNSLADPYRLWQLTHDERLTGRSIQLETQMRQKCRPADKRDDSVGDVRRAAHFFTHHYELECTCDRVPYTWDFGFLVLRREAWLRAQADTLVRTVFERLTQQHSDLNGLSKELTIETEAPYASELQIDRLPSMAESYVSWREFFEACHRVASQARRITNESWIPFDLDMPSAESFSCLALEILASEKLERIGRYPEAGIGDIRDEHRLVESLSIRHCSSAEEMTRKFSLIDWLEIAHLTHDHGIHEKGRALDFFQALYLVTRVTERDRFVPSDESFMFPSGAASPNAVAMRAWYGTASRVMGREGEDWVLARLPGNFSTRGDWFLGITAGSRSKLLGQRAIDIMSSRRANILRLHAGIGLPVRDIFETSKDDILRTALYKTNEHGIRTNIPYEELVNYGVPASNGSATKPAFFWLWRSQIRDYDRHMRVWQKWLCRMVELFHEFGQAEAASQDSKSLFHPGQFEAYDLAQKDLTGLRKYLQLIKLGPDNLEVNFLRHCGFLVSELKAASPQKRDLAPQTTTPTEFHV